LGNFPQKGVEYGQIGMAVASFCPSSHGIYVDVQNGWAGAKVYRCWIPTFI